MLLPLLALARGCVSCTMQQVTPATRPLQLLQDRKHTTAEDAEPQPCRHGQDGDRDSEELIPSMGLHHATLSPRKTGTSWRHTLSLLTLAVLVLSLFMPTSAVFIDFENCLPDSQIKGNTLQFRPLYVDAKFIKGEGSLHNLSVVAYGNVTGQNYQTPLPPASDTDYWANPNQTNGKILNLSTPGTYTGSPKITVFDVHYALLTYDPFESPPLAFCNNTLSGTSCPVGPVFNTSVITQQQVDQLRAFGYAHVLDGTYSFATLSATLHVNSADDDASGNPLVVACVSAAVTPYLGDSLSDLVAYLPVVILFFVAVAVMAASIASPWGTTDVFKWTSNYGRDEDLIRLVTPGFADCLQYIQFAILAGSLTLNYPGFFQPIVSQVSWAALMFNVSFVNGGAHQNPQDGIYVTSGPYGLSHMRQIIGLAQDDDIWAGTVVWSLVIIAIVLVTIQVGFFVSWMLRLIAHTTPEDLRSKNWPLTGGCIVRVVCNFFLLPIVSLSFFQLVIAEHSPVYIVVLAVILLVLILIFAGWILRVIFVAKPRSKLFDDLPTVLLYGPLYNTYSDEAAPFTMIPALLTFIRGVAIGAVQPSGIAQIVILAICEVVLILTLNAFRPFNSPTSMNAYHTTFSVVRLVVVLLSIVFVPALGVTESPRGWVGYVILVLHAIVLVFAFFLNAIQTLVEVVARALGAGGDSSTGAATRGGLVRIFGARQLSRRERRTRPGFRGSMHSDAAILTEDGEVKSQIPRSRSMSASSAILLNQRASRDRLSAHLDQMSPGMLTGTPMTGESTYQFPVSAAIAGPAATDRPALGIKTDDISDPYYRTPRQRRATGDTAVMMTPGSRSRGSWAADNWPEGQPEATSPEAAAPVGEVGRGASFSPDRYMRERDGSDPNITRRTNVDYAVREVDFYYGVRGPALNSEQPSRRLKTGPADPVGPVSSATGWFKNILGRGTKDSPKGFEVVRSKRAPPEGFQDEPAPAPFQEPYRDNPASIDEAGPVPGAKTRSSTRGTDSDADADIADARRSDSYRGPSPIDSDDEQWEGGHRRIVSAEAPKIEDMDFGGGIELPSRIGSRSTKAAQSRQPSTRQPMPSRGPSVRSEVEQVQIPGGPSLLPAIDEPIAPIILDRRASRLQRSASPRVPFTTSGRRSMGADSILSLEPDAAAGEQEQYGEELTRQPTAEWGAFQGQNRGSLSINQSSHVSTSPHSSRRSGELPEPGHVGVLGLSPPSSWRGDRPTSMGQVSSHRASDGIQLPSIEHAAQGHEAEIMSGSPRHSRGPSTNSLGGNFAPGRP